MIIPGDLLTDSDLWAIEDRMSEEFGDQTRTLLVTCRRQAVLDWLSPRLEAGGYYPARLRTRHQPLYGFAYTASAYSDVTTKLGDSSASDVDLRTVLATPASDFLYVGHRIPFSGLFIGMTGTVNATASVITVCVWNGSAWVPVPSQVDETTVQTGMCLSGGGRITWLAPDDWAERSVNSRSAYWARVQISNALSGSVPVNQVLPIVRSRLAGPVYSYVLSLMGRAASSTRRGNWSEFADKHETQAERALDLVMGLIVDEFDMDGDDAVGPTEVVGRSDAVSSWSIERG